MGGVLKKVGRNKFPAVMIWTQGVRYSGRRNKIFEKGFTLGGLPPKYFWKKNNFGKKSKKTNKNQVFSIYSNLGVWVLVSPRRQPPLGGRKREVGEGVGGLCLSGGDDMWPASAILQRRSVGISNEK